MSDHRPDYLQHLKGKSVTLTFEDDQVQVAAVDGWTLHVYNACTLFGDEQAGNIGQRSLRLELVDYLFDDVKMILKFSGDTLLTIDLTGHGDSGPEAMQLNGPDGSIDVWS